MNRVELLTVEDSFEIIGRGVVLIPDFSLPKGWKNRIESIVVAKPDGQTEKATAQFSMSHINIPDPQVSVDKRWRIIVLVVDRRRDEVPVGSRILVSPEVRDALFTADSPK